LQYLGSTKTATVDRDWKVAPDATSDFVIIADAGRAHVNEGLAQAGTNNTVTLNTLASAGDDAYVGQIVHIRSGTGADQAGTVIAYNGTSKVATVHKNWDTNPDTTSGYVMLPSSPVELTDNAIDLIWDEPLTNPTHNVANSAGRRLRFLQESGSVYGGFIWIDTINGTAGTSDYENGTSDNPVNSIADANTLAASLGIDRFMVSPGSSLTFAATQSNEEFHGKNWTLALGGQSIAGTFINGATITGIGTGSNYHLHDCHLGTGTLADGDISFTSIDGTLTLSAAGSYRLNGCYSGIAGAATPTIDFGAAVGNTALNMRHYSGGVTIANKDAVGTDTMSLEGNGKLVVAASSSGVISIRGNFNVTNTGGATITYDDNTLGIANIETDTTSIETKVDTVDANVDLILADTGTDGVVLSSATQTAIADALLNRDMSAVSDTTARSPLNALRLLRNKYSVAGSTLTVTKEDDSTSAWTSTLTTDATADPVTGSDPA
jgi:hypothetical protein